MTSQPVIAESSSETALVKLDFRPAWLHSSWALMWRWQPEFPIDMEEGQAGADLLNEAKETVARLGGTLKLRPDLEAKRGPASLLWTEAGIVAPKENLDALLDALAEEMEKGGESSPLAALFSLKKAIRVKAKGSTAKGRGGHTARTMTRATLTNGEVVTQDNVHTINRANFAVLSLK